MSKRPRDETSEPVQPTEKKARLQGILPRHVCDLPLLLSLCSWTENVVLWSPSKAKEWAHDEVGLDEEDAMRLEKQKIDGERCLT